MKTLAIAPLLAGAAGASSSSIAADSHAGRRLLSGARRLGGGDEGEIAWAAGYSLRFEKCATTTDYAYFGGDNGGNGNNNYYANGEQRVVHFKLCPTYTCGSGCSGGEYVVEMYQFLEAYLEYKQEMMEAQCERVAQNCYCDDVDDDEMCEAQCYKNAGIYNDCVDQDDNNGNGQQGEQFELREAANCGRLDVDEDAAQYWAYQNYGNGNGQYNYNGNGNDNGNQNQEVEFFAGPYCSSNGKSIFLGVYMDEYCSYEAPKGVYEKLSYGRSLPYSDESIVEDECISCLEPVEEEEEDENGDENNNADDAAAANDDANAQGNGGDDYVDNYNGNYNGGDDDYVAEVTDFCQRLYEDAGKCEREIDVYGYYSNTLACDFIDDLGRGVGKRVAAAVGRAAHAPKAIAGVFAVTTLALAGVAWHLRRKVKDGEKAVGLIDQGTGAMA